jgi:hypothetical protein
LCAPKADLSKEASQRAHWIPHDRIKKGTGERRKKFDLIQGKAVVGAFGIKNNMTGPSLIASLIAPRRCGHSFWRVSKYELTRDREPTPL